MDAEIVIRGARPSDYPEFRKLEEFVWQGTVPPLEKEVFLLWIKVFSDGFRLAVVNDKIMGHVYAQICEYDPFDENDNRSLYKVTNDCTTLRTHNPNGNSVYSFSIWSLHGGAGLKLNEYYVSLTKKLNKQYYVGPVRMLGLADYAKKKNRKKLSMKFVAEYAGAVRDTAKKRLAGKDRVFDSVVTPLLKLPGSDFARVIKNFFPYARGAERWGCVLYHPNSNYKK